MLFSESLYNKMKRHVPFRLQINSPKFYISSIYHLFSSQNSKITHHGFIIHKRHSITDFLSFSHNYTAIQEI